MATVLLKLRKEKAEGSLRQKVQNSKLRWLVHDKKIEVDRIPRKMEELAVKEKRPRGRS